jgi:uncharacterized caspase-like protein
MARAAAFLSVFILLLLSTAGGDACADGKRVALVIGNSNYVRSGQILKNPANDAKDIAGQLQKIGFEVIVLLDADRTRMAAAVEDFTSRIAGAEAALFYYAGHGIQYANRNWLIPIDVEVKSNTQPKLSLLALDEIQDGIADQKVGTTILVLDACRDNPFAVRVGTRAAAAAGLAAVKGGNDTYIAFSTEPGNVAVDGAGRNSPFAEALLKAIPKAGQSLHKAMLAVKQEVRKATGGTQTPWTQDNLPADFYFVSLNAEPAVVESEEQDWALVKDSNNSGMLQSFLSKYPNGKNSLAAQMALNRAALQEMKKELQSQQEIAIWNSVKDSSNPALLKSYLRQYPKGIFAQQAEALLSQFDIEQQARQARQEAEKRREEQAAKEKELQKIEAERRVQELDAKQRANAAELNRLEEEKRKVQEELRLAKEAKDKAEAARIAAEKAAEQSRSEAKKEGEAAEDVAKKQQEAEKAREALKDAQRKKEQADKEAADRAAEARKAEEARKAAEEAARVKAIKDAQVAEAKKVADEAARAKALKDAKDAEARKAAEEAARQKAIKDAQAKKEAEEKKAQEEARLKKLKEEEQKTRDAEQAAKNQRQEKQRELEEAQRQQEQKDADAKRARDQQQQKRKPVEKAPYRPAGPPRQQEKQYNPPQRRQDPIMHGIGG